MAAELLTDLSRATDSNANPLSGARWFFYATGTTTPQPTYTTAALLIEHPNPVVADAGGQFPSIYFNSSLAYRGVLTTSGGVTLRDVDPINAGLASSLASPAGAEMVGFRQSGAGATNRSAAAKLSERISVLDYGADPTGATNSTTAFAAAAAQIVAQGGGELLIPPGTYTLGAQTLTGSVGADWSWQPAPILNIIDCTKPVSIIGYGAKLVCAPGLRFGSYDPVTGAKTSPALPHTTNSSRASPYQAFVLLFNNTANVRVAGMEIDGRSADQIIGGQYGDTGYQIPADGIYAYGNASLTIEDVYVHHCLADGVHIGYAGLTKASKKRPHTLRNVVSEFNTRQGISWVGGNSLTMISCRFAKTGRTVNADLGGVLVSAPAAGMDVEAESSVCRGGMFIDCEWSDNHGVGVLSHAPSDNADITVIRGKIVGTTNWSCWPNNPGWRFFDTLFLGAVTNVHSSPDINASTQFRGCTFSADVSQSETGALYWNNYLVGDIDAPNALFDRCLFGSGGSTAKPLVFFANGRVSDCHFFQDGAGTMIMRGRCSGRVVLEGASAGFDTSGIVIDGEVIQNNVTFGRNTGLKYLDKQVLGARQAAVADPTGGATVDAEARTALNALLARLRTHGLIEP